MGIKIEKKDTRKQFPEWNGGNKNLPKYKEYFPGAESRSAIVFVVSRKLFVQSLSKEGNDDFLQHKCQFEKESLQSSCRHYEFNSKKTVSFFLSVIEKKETVKYKL